MNSDNKAVFPPEFSLVVFAGTTVGVRVGFRSLWELVVDTLVEKVPYLASEVTLTGAKLNLILDPL